MKIMHQMSTAFGFTTVEGLSKAIEAVSVQMGCRPERIWIPESAQSKKLTARGGKKLAKESKGQVAFAPVHVWPSGGVEAKANT